MAQPASLPRWATSGAVITDPPSGQKDTGWTVNQAPPASYFNWYMNLVYQWTLYLQGLSGEALTWTNVHIFNAPNDSGAMTINGDSGNTSRVASAFVFGGDYTGATSSTRGGTGIDSTGGAANSGGTGGRGLLGTGGSGTIGGVGVRGVGGGAIGAGQAAGYGGEFQAGNGDQGNSGIIATGGNSSGATQEGGNGLEGRGGTATGSKKAGRGANVTGADGDLWSGIGLQVNSGDVTGTSGSTLARAGIYLQQGDVFTNSGKGTRTTAVAAEAAIMAYPGVQQSGGDIFPNNGIFVGNKAAVNKAAFEQGHYGIILDPGLFLKQNPIDTTAYPAGTALSLPFGTMSPWGILAVACRLKIDGGSGGGNFTVAFESGVDRLNCSSVVRTSSTTIRLTFTSSFLSGNTYFPLMQSNRSNLMPKISGVPAANTLDFSLTNFSSTIDLDASSDNNIPVYLMCFGR